MAHWTLDDIPWERFEPQKLDPELLRIVKAASLVEQNGADYARYLCGVFADDAAFQDAVRRWGEEEIQHGIALGRYAHLADPTFDHAAACARFTAGFRVDLDATASVRGSRASELVARCIVETGTSSYYIALSEATDEPVLKAICQRIAADELRHYKLFLTPAPRGFLKRRIIGEDAAEIARVIGAILLDEARGFDEAQQFGIELLPLEMRPRNIVERPMRHGWSVAS